MASDRAYRRRMEEAVILRILNEESGAQFDPALVAAFEAAWREGRISPAGASSACQAPGI